MTTRGPPVAVNSLRRIEYGQSNPARLLEHARESGELRDDVGVYDIPLMQLMLGALADVTGTVDPDQWRRFLGILLDGMRTRRRTPTPLPGEPLDAERYTAAMAGQQAGIAVSLACGRVLARCADVLAACSASTQASSPSRRDLLESRAANWSIRLMNVGRQPGCA